MDEMIFIGALVVLVIAGVFLIKVIQRKNTGRKPNHPVYQQSSRHKPHHRPASHSMVHSHSTDRMQADNGVWRTSRLKSNETRWESGVVVANKILTDSELALEERDTEESHGHKPAAHKPTGTWNGSSNRSRGTKRGRA